MCKEIIEWLAISDIPHPFLQQINYPWKRVYLVLTSAINMNSPYRTQNIYGWVAGKEHAFSKYKDNQELLIKKPDYKEANIFTCIKIVKN